MAGPRLSMEVGNDGVALITLLNPPVNSLAIPSMLILYISSFSSNLVSFDLNYSRWNLLFSVKFVVVIAGLKEKYDEALKRNDVKAIVINGKLKLWSEIITEENVKINWLTVLTV